ncbi:MAG: cytochrome b/b6 domain-containing protein, partial [Bdellovibrio sp.]
LRNPMWDWHIYLGYLLTFLIVMRIFLSLKNSTLHPWKRLSQVSPRQPGGSWHLFAVQVGYALFYLVTLFMVISGLILTFKEQWGLEKNLTGPIKEVHELLMWFFVVFVGGHLLGVVIAENRQDGGLVSDMIHGGEKAPRS